MKGLILAISLFCFTARSQEAIRLYEGPAPGSENWNWEEKVNQTPGGRFISDVTTPVIIPFPAPEPNGTAVVVAPGGAFHILAIDHEGIDVAKWLNNKGITVFVLKYRLTHPNPDNPEHNLMTLMQNKDYATIDSLNAQVVPLAMQDGLKALEYVRSNAATYRVDPAKIGFMGFSAGGTLTMSVAYNATDQNRPNFVAPIYAYGGAILGDKVPAVRTPIFVAAASDDELGFAPHSAQIYLKWLEAGQPAELHIYEKGGHGFGMRKTGNPVDSWIEEFHTFLLEVGF
jgi:acetyl esterase/lipase